ncbi:MAG: spore coat protein CotJB [Oscillospiraceae bacterium]|jgi:spore coat protein JB|nr:spore coat protein CotJB [Oscillospiraceae bacterium]
MDRKQLLWQMSAEQFAAFDVLLYLDTHPNDRNALQMYDKYLRNHMRYQREYENMAGPLTSDAAAHGSWRWVDDPWPWEREAN